MPQKRKQSSLMPLTDLVNNEPNTKKVRRSSITSVRLMPDILNTSTEFGSPHKFWDSLCEKDESYYRSPDYMKKYPKLESPMRQVLMAWIMDVCEELTLQRETYHLTIDFIDRLLSKGDIDARPQTLQLIGVSSLLLATKIEEVYPPKLAELVSSTANACTDEEVRCMEEIILSKLEWHCSPVTAVQWLAFYLHLIAKQELEPFLHGSSPSSSDYFPSSSGGDSMKSQYCPSILNASTSTDSQYVSQDPELRMSVEFNTSLDHSFVVKNHSQMRHLGQFSIPKLMRDDFIVLTKVVELCMFDMNYLAFTYSQIAAAIVMLSYEPRDKVEAITGFHYADLEDAIFFIEPVIRVTRANVTPGVVIPQFQNIDPRDYHNIQTGYASDYDTLLKEIEKMRRNSSKMS